MALDNESFNKQLYDLLKVRGYNPVPKNSKNQDVDASQLADVIEFQFTKDGENYGKAWASIDDAKNVIIYYDEAQADSPEGNTPGLDYDDSWSGFLKHVKTWAQRKQLSFELLNKDRLNDAMKQREYVKMKENLREGYYPMGKQASYSDAVPTVKIILQHTRQIQEGEQRYRNIAKIFLENAQGERILAPTTRPGIAQVYARHLAEGGLPNDQRWNHLKSLCEEYQKMAGFVRATRNGQFNESAQQLVNEGINHYNKLRESLGKLRGHRGYNAYFESWTPALMEDESEENNLNELFVQETMDPRIESAMPILSRLRKHVGEISEVNSLAEWADGIINEKLDLQLDEEERPERPYICVHARKGQCEVTASSSYGAAQKAAQKWKLKSTAGIDAYLADVKHSTSMIGEEAEQIDEVRGIGHEETYDERQSKKEADRMSNLASKLRAKLDAIEKPKSQAAHTKALKSMDKYPAAQFAKMRKGDGTVRTDEISNSTWMKRQNAEKKAKETATEKDVAKNVAKTRAERDYHASKLEPDAWKYGAFGQRNPEITKKLHSKADKEYSKALDDIKKTPVAKFVKGRKGDGKVRTDENAKQVNEVSTGKKMAVAYRAGKRYIDARNQDAYFDKIGAHSLRDADVTDKKKHLDTIRRSGALGKLASVAGAIKKTYAEESEQIDEAGGFIMDKGMGRSAGPAPFEGGRTVKSKKPADERVKKIAKGMQKQYTKEAVGKEGKIDHDHYRKTQQKQTKAAQKADKQASKKIDALSAMHKAVFKNEKMLSAMGDSELNEISRGLAVNYNNKASDDISDRQYGVLRGRPDQERKIANREKGMDLAQKKLGWGNAKVRATLESMLSEGSDTPLIDMEDYLEKKKELQYLLKHPESSTPKFRQLIQHRLGRLEQQKKELMSTGLNEGMGEADMIVQDIISGEQDAYSIMSSPTTPEEEYVAKILQKEYNNVASETGLNPDDDLEEILDIVIERLSDKYNHGSLNEVDMGQADRTLRQTQRGDAGKMSQGMALNKAATQMGYDHYMDVPDDKVDELHVLVKKIRSGEVEEGLDINQKRAGQLGPTEKVGPKGAVGKLVGANESVEHDPLDDIKRLLGK